MITVVNSVVEAIVGKSCSRVVVMPLLRTVLLLLLLLVVVAVVIVVVASVFVVGVGARTTL